MRQRRLECRSTSTVSTLEAATRCTQNEHSSPGIAGGRERHVHGHDPTAIGGLLRGGPRPAPVEHGHERLRGEEAKVEAFVA
jgi:hypothetical protein